MGADKTKKNCLFKENIPVCEPGFVLMHMLNILLYR